LSLKTIGSYWFSKLEAGRLESWEARMLESQEAVRLEN
jgi:hypothetical protein